MIKKFLVSILVFSITASPLSGCGATSNSSSFNVTSEAETTIAAETTAPAETTASTEKTNKSSNEYTNSGSKKEKVICSMCNGTGKVKYYYGDSALEAALNGHNDYEYGPCTSCDGTGYTYITTSGGSSSSSNLKTCPSCGKKVKSLLTKKDAAGESRTWCSSCWSEYDSIMGR